MLQGLELLRHDRDLLGQLFGLRLLSKQLVLHDLELIDGLLLSDLKTLRRFKKISDLLGRNGASDSFPTALSGFQPRCTSTPPRPTNVSPTTMANILR